MSPPTPREAARAWLVHETERFQQARERRNAFILEAALVLSQREICEITGLSPETVRQITKGHPVSWRRRVTTQKLPRHGQ